MLRRLLAVTAIALIVVLAGFNWFQWRLRHRRGPVQDLPAAPAESIDLADRPDALPPGLSGAARSAVLLIGDGMGVTHVAAAALRSGDGTRLRMETMPVTGLARTHSANHLVTGSAAGATALSTGVRTRNSMLGIDPAGRPRRHLLEAAAEAGKAVGIVTTDRVTGATPAGFAVHVVHRDRTEEIARALTETRLDLLVGGGRDELQGRGLEEVARLRGFRPVFDLESLRGADPGRVLALLAPGRLPTPGPSLRELTEIALARLAGDPDGFVLVVENTHVDLHGHEWRGGDATDHVLALDRAVGAALAHARAAGDTLVLVTADHETGGLAVTTRERSPDRPVALWSTHGHTAAPVPVFAEGPGSEAFTGVRHLAGVGRRLRAVLGLTDR